LEVVKKPRGGKGPAQGVGTLIQKAETPGRKKEEKKYGFI